jgi:predicted ATPase
MKIISFEVLGLFGSPEPIKLMFNEDMNIITGRNGAGKTSIMKLMWYFISGNIEFALSEVNFSKATLTTSTYTCTVAKLNRNTCTVSFSIGDESYFFEDLVDGDGDVFRNAEDEANSILMDIGNSVFLPTFRRIEGGFSIRPSRTPFGRLTRNKGEVEEALSSLSKKISNAQHTFVTSISSSDIVEILLRKYADLSQVYNDFQENTSQEIIDRIRAYESYTTENDHYNTANTVLAEVKKKVQEMETKRSEIMTPMEELRGVVEKLFKHVGIRIDSRLNFGDAARAVHSDELSAGEKQMLSFLCYNAFYSDSIIFIDEPELSLHVDWQRQLFSILSRQNSTNQFVIATHSPFIYSKYPDKELSLDSDRGDMEGE